MARFLLKTWNSWSGSWPANHSREPLLNLPSIIHSSHCMSDQRCAIQVLLQCLSMLCWRHPLCDVVCREEEVTTVVETALKEAGAKKTGLSFGDLRRRWRVQSSTWMWSFPWRTSHCGCCNFSLNFRQQAGGEWIESRASSAPVFQLAVCTYVPGGGACKPIRKYWTALLVAQISRA